mmetsp:Transcript_15058/g.42254  ORF Transcript_15058/g.42254 Transcript_15058/m.42254 type:complete len:906 (+) Transcript_15058:883-3600(+)
MRSFSAAAFCCAARRSSSFLSSSAFSSTSLFSRVSRSSSSSSLIACRSSRMYLFCSSLCCCRAADNEAMAALGSVVPEALGEASVSRGAAAPACACRSASSAWKFRTSGGTWTGAKAGWAGADALAANGSAEEACGMAVGSEARARGGAPPACGNSEKAAGSWGNSGMAFSRRAFSASNLMRSAARRCCSSRRSCSRRSASWCRAASRGAILFGFCPSVTCRRASISCSWARRSWRLASRAAASSALRSSIFSAIRCRSSASRCFMRARLSSVLSSSSSPVCVPSPMLLALAPTKGGGCATRAWVPVLCCSMAALRLARRCRRASSLSLSDACSALAAACRSSACRVALWASISARLAASSPSRCRSNASLSCICCFSSDSRCCMARRSPSSRLRRSSRIRLASSWCSSCCPRFLATNCRRSSSSFFLRSAAARRSMGPPALLSHLSRRADDGPLRSTIDPSLVGWREPLTMPAPSWILDFTARVCLMALSRLRACSLVASLLARTFSADFSFSLSFSRKAPVFCFSSSAIRSLASRACGTTPGRSPSSWRRISPASKYKPIAFMCSSLAACMSARACKYSFSASCLKASALHARACRMASSSARAFSCIILALASAFSDIAAEPRARVNVSSASLTAAASSSLSAPPARATLRVSKAVSTPTSAASRAIMAARRSPSCSSTTRLASPKPFSASSSWESLAVSWVAVACATRASCSFIASQASSCSFLAASTAALAAAASSRSFTREEGSTSGSSSSSTADSRSSAKAHCRMEEPCISCVWCRRPRAAATAPTASAFTAAALAMDCARGSTAVRAAAAAGGCPADCEGSSSVMRSATSSSMSSHSPISSSVCCSVSLASDSFPCTFLSVTTVVSTRTCITRRTFLPPPLAAASAALSASCASKRD